MVLGEGGSSRSPGMMSTPPPRRTRSAARLALTDGEEQLSLADADREVELTPEAAEAPSIVNRESISGEAASLLSPAGHAKPSAEVVTVDNVAEQTANFIKNRKAQKVALKEKEKEKERIAALKAACEHNQPIRKRLIGKTSPVTLLAGGAKAKAKAKAKGTPKGKGEGECD